MKQKKFILPREILLSIAVTKNLVHSVETDDDIAILKGAALLYEKVVLNTEGGPFDSIAEFLAEELNTRQKLKLSDLLQPASEHPNYEAIVKNSQFLKVVLETIGVNQ